MGKWYDVNSDIPTLKGAFVDAPLFQNQKLVFADSVDYNGQRTTGAQLAWESHLETIAIQAPRQADGTILDTPQKVSNAYKTKGEIEYYIPEATPYNELTPEKQALGHSWLRPKKVTHKASDGIQWYFGRYVANEGGTYKRSVSSGAYNSVGPGILIDNLSGETTPLIMSLDFYTANAVVAYMGEVVKNPEFDANAEATKSNKRGATSPIDRNKYFIYTDSGPITVMVKGVSR